MPPAPAPAAAAERKVLPIRFETVSAIPSTAMTAAVAESAEGKEAGTGASEQELGVKEALRGAYTGAKGVSASTNGATASVRFSWENDLGADSAADCATGGIRDGGRGGVGMGLRSKRTIGGDIIGASASAAAREEKQVYQSSSSCAQYDRPAGRRDAYGSAAALWYDRGSAKAGAGAVDRGATGAGPWTEPTAAAETARSLPGRAWGRDEGGAVGRGEAFRSASWAEKLVTKKEEQVRPGCVFVGGIKWGWGRGMEGRRVKERRREGEGNNRRSLKTNDYVVISLLLLLHFFFS